MYADVLPDGLPEILPPYENGIFQAVLTLPESRAALVSAVGAFIGQPVASVTLRQNENPVRSADAKQERYDIHCSVGGENGDQCNVEMQASPMAGDSRGNEHRNIKWRSVYNLCHLHANQKGRGLRYGHFVRSYQIMLCNYKAFDFKNEPVERYTFRNQKGVMLCDAVTSVFIDLTQAREIMKKPVDEMSDIECWIVFFALGNDPKCRESIAGIAKAKEGIAVAYDTLLSISASADERARYLSRRMWLQDQEHVRVVMREEGLEEGRKEGLEEGREEGYQKARLEYEAKSAAKDAEIEALRALLRAQSENKSEGQP